MEEVYQAKRIFQEWNDKKAEQAGKVFLPVDWSVKAEDLNRADIIVGIIGDWIESPSFIEECIYSGKEVFLFFRKSHNLEVSIPGEVKAIESFTEKIKPICPCLGYDDYDDFKGLLSSLLITK